MNGSNLDEPPLLTDVVEALPLPRHRVPSLDTAKLKRLVANQPTRSALMAVAAGAVAMSLVRLAFQRRRSAGERSSH